MGSILTRFSKYKPLRYVLLYGAMAALWVYSERLWLKVDLTSDKRHTVHAYTRSLLKEAKDGEIVLKIYLAGDLPLELKRLQSFTKGLLQTLKRYACGGLRYEFVDVAELPLETRKSLLKTWTSYGLQPTTLRNVEEVRPDKDGTVFPFIRLTYLDREHHSLMLEGERIMSLSQMAEQSMQRLEQVLATALHAVLRPETQRLALLRGHGEPDIRSLRGLTSALQKTYALDVVNFCAETNLCAYDAVLITGPQKSFSEAEKYRIDQYIMQGGKVLFFLDALRVDLQELRKGRAFAQVVENNLADVLFKYGCRINADFVQDACSGVYPVVTGRVGNQPQIGLMRWPFFPILSRFAKHPITKNLGPIASKFISSIDPICTQGVRHVPLVFSSEHARVLTWPVCVDLKELHTLPSDFHFDKSRLPLAYLLEGEFTSAYVHRFQPSVGSQDPFVATSKPTKLFCMGTSTVVCNDWNGRENRPMPWGYDPFLEEQFSNQAWVLHTLAYMLKDRGLIELSDRSLQSKHLHPLRVKRERLFWQVWNFSVPSLGLLLLCMGWHTVRKSRFARAIPKKQ